MIDMYTNFHACRVKLVLELNFPNIPGGTRKSFVSVYILYKHKVAIYCFIISFNETNDTIIQFPPITSSIHQDQLPECRAQSHFRLELQVFALAAFEVSPGGKKTRDLLRCFEKKGNNVM